MKLSYSKLNLSEKYIFCLSRWGGVIHRRNDKKGWYTECGILSMQDIDRHEPWNSDKNLCNGCFKRD